MLKKKLWIVANWKENKTIVEAKKWIQGYKDISIPGLVEVVICPSYPLIPDLREKLITYHLSRLTKLGAQDISKFEGGRYTGEVSAKQLSNLVDYVLVGHSERRKYFSETGEIINQKISLCLKYNLTPIICVSNLKQVKNIKHQTPARQSLRLHPPASSREASQAGALAGGSNIKHFFAYEPLEAIGTGKPDTPKNAQKVAEEIKKLVNVKVLYGGSVNSQNVKNFVKQPDIDGVLIGQASLDVEEFLRIIKNAKIY